MVRSAAITVSDRCAAGERADRSGPVLAAALSDAGYEVDTYLVPDGEAAVAEVLRLAVTSGARLVGIGRQRCADGGTCR